MHYQFPSRWSIIVVWALLLVYLSYLFLYKSKSVFFQLNYDWDAIAEIENLGAVTVDTLSHDYLALEGDINYTNNINLLHTFQIEEEEKNYFRASAISFSDSQVKFSGVRWINGMPNNLFNSPNFKVIHLPIIQEGTKTITTIGDSQMLWDEGRDFRKNLHLKNSDLVFKGNFKDVNGYPHEAGIYKTTNDIIKELPNILNTSYYVLFFGAHDKKTNRDNLQAEVCEIVTTLNLREETKKIIILNLPPSPIEEFENFNRAFNKIIESCALNNEKVKIITLYEELESQTGYLMEDNVHLNKRGLNVATTLINRALK